MRDIVVGIDLGTSNSVISVVLEGETIVVPDMAGNRIHPSLVYFFEDGETLIGNDARPYLLKDPAHTVYSAKRLIGRPYDSPELRVHIGSFPFKIVASDDGAPRINQHGALHPPEGISARVLAHLKELAEDFLGQRVTKAVVTVPANFDEGQRRATKRAAELAGLEVLRLVNEPTAAALAYGYGHNRREKVAIYDFGGGTFDITILELRGDVFQVLSTAGNSYLGGDDFDNRLVTSMLNAFEKQYGYDLAGEDAIRQRLKAVAQDIKHKLSAQELVTARVSEMVPGTLTELELEFSLSREAFNKRCADIVDQSLQTCEEALKLAGLQRAEIDHLVLVGGTTRVPLVQRRVTEFFNRQPVVDINPDEVVSIGAAIFGASLVEQQAAPQAAYAPAGGYDDTYSGEEWGEELDVDDLEELSVEELMEIDEIEEVRRDPGPMQPAVSGVASVSAGYGGASGGGYSYGGGSSGHGGYSPAGGGASRAPLLIDVTPHALGVATVGGVMDVIIERNGSIPLERTRYFSTSRDNQTRVVLPIFSGNSRRIEENRQLGTLELHEIPPGPREDVQIEVTFEVDTNGMLSVHATDMRTGRAQSAHLSIMGESDEDFDATDLLSV